MSKSWNDNHRVGTERVHREVKCLARRHRYQTKQLLKVIAAL